jgi:hypothetical protein
MHPTIDAIFNEAEKRYLNPDELGLVTQYVDSLGDRLELYRLLRDQELILLQPIADQLEGAFPQAETKLLERVLKNGILALRACTMAMLLKDEHYIQERIAWLQQVQTNYNSQSFDQAFYKFLEQQLKQKLSAKQLALLQPSLTEVKTALQQPQKAVSLDSPDEDLSVASLF